MGLNYVTPFCQVKTGALSPYGSRSVILRTEASEIFIPMQFLSLRKDMALV